MQVTAPIPPDVSPRRGRPRTAGLRETILRAAEGIFARHDFHEVLMDDVAGAAGVAKGTLYRYFPGKHELYLAVMFRGIEQLRDELQAVVEKPDPPLRKIERVVHCVLAHFWSRKLFFALIHRNEHKAGDPDHREWMRRRSELSHIVQRAIEEAAAARVVRPVDPRIATEMLFGMLRGVNRFRGPEDTLEGLVQMVVEIFLAGAGTAATRRKLALASDGGR